MVVLVTGSTGFIGSHVVRVLSERGLEVRAGMRDLGLAKMFDGFEGVTPVKMDLFDVDSLRDAVRGCEDVIHCAAALYVGAKDAQRDVVDPSVVGVKNLCSVMDGVKRIVHTSSVAAIRSSRYQHGKIFTVDDWCDDASVESNPYGFAKAEAERVIRAWAENRDVRLVTIHPSIVFGPIFHRRHAEGSMSYIKHFVKGPPFVLDFNVNFVDVRDVAEAHVNALEMGKDRARHLIHARGMWMKEIGVSLNQTFGGGFSTRRLPAPLAYFIAIFHPKLSWKQLRGGLGKRVEYDARDSFEELGVEITDHIVTLKDSVESLRAQG